MRLTIINENKCVYVGNYSYSHLDINTIPSNVHALQWQDDKGWIEYNDGQANEFIDTLPSWANDAKLAWEEAKANEKPIIIDEAINLTDEQKLTLVRMERNARLAACDWTQLEDAPSSIDKSAWAKYRQALRDLPENITDIDIVIYPTPPNI